MITRRDFATRTACAICAVTGLAPAATSAQGAPTITSGGVTRKILSRTEGPAPGYITLLVEATIPAGILVVRHKHPGVESAYVLEGGVELPIEGQPTRTFAPGDGYQIPVGVPHGGGKANTMDTRILITYVVEKDKPIASAA